MAIDAFVVALADVAGGALAFVLEYDHTLEVRVSNTIDDQGAYKVRHPFDLTRLGFSQTGALQVANAMPVTAPSDRQRLAWLAAAAAAVEKSGTLEFLNSNSQQEIFQATRRLRELGISLRGADQVVRALQVADARDRARITQLVAAALSRASSAAAEFYDYPGAYAQRFDSGDKS